MNDTPKQMLNGIPISDGFDFPVGPRGDNVTVWDTHKVDATLADPNYKKLYNAWHTGEDWNGRGGGDTDLGDPVYAVSHGRVAEFGYYTPSWGNIVLLEHVMPDGTLVWSQYAHLDEIVVEEVGQIVIRGEQIGTIGKGERTASKPRGRWIAHLHFEIRRNKLAINIWRPLVNSREQIMANYYSPTPFINEHRPAIFSTQANILQRPQVIVDSQKTDRETGSFRKANVDHWYSAPYGYQGTMLWTYAAVKTEANWAEWRPNLPSAGEWEVWVYIPERHTTTGNARYRIVYDGGRTEVSIGQNNYSNQWAKLGTFPFQPGQGYVRLSDVTGERKRGLMVGFDAIRWVKGSEG
jgi:hypothetical protein